MLDEITFLLSDSPLPVQVGYSGMYRITISPTDLTEMEILNFYITIFN